MLVRDAITKPVLTVGPEHTLRQVAELMSQRRVGSAIAAMAEGGFRHLVVLEGSEVLGVISVRDIMRVWVNHTTPARYA